MTNYVGFWAKKAICSIEDFQLTIYTCIKVFLKQENSFEKFIIQTLIHPALYSKEINMFCEIGYGPMNLSPGGIRFSPFSLHSILQSQQF